MSSSRARPLAHDRSFLAALSVGLGVAMGVSCSLVSLDSLTSGASSSGGSVGGHHSAGGGGGEGGGGGAAGGGGTGGVPDPGSCAARAPFIATEPVLATPILERAGRLAADELTLYFHTVNGSEFDGGPGNTDVMRAVRKDLGAMFAGTAPVKELDMPTSADQQASLTADGLEVFFASDRGGSLDVWQARRSSTSVGFGNLELLADVDSAADDVQPFVSADGFELWFASDRAPSCAGCMDLYFSKRVGGTFAPPLAAAGSDFPPGYRGHPVLSADKRTLYFSHAPAVSGPFDIWMAERASPTDDFAGPVLVEELVTGSNQVPGWLSPDGCRLYFDRDDDIWVARKR